MTRLFILLFFILTAFGLLTGCSTQHTVRHQAKLSRDYTFIVFSKKNSFFHVKEEVGGEHINVYKVWGLEGESYDISLTSSSGMAEHALLGEGIRMLDGNSSGKNLSRIAITGVDAVFVVHVYAHPYAEYELTIQRL